MAEFKVGFLGFGNIGYGVYKILESNRDVIFNKEKISFKIEKILVKNKSKKRNVELDKNLLTDDYKDIVENDDISIVIEVIGGVEPARTFILEALNNKKTVVTANKEVVARYWEEFEDAARKNNVGFYYEASVAGGIPIIKAVGESLQANTITDVMGIINGTTNYIFTKMSDENEDLNNVLEEAKKLGYAEPDPTADISGLDVMYKLSILGSIAFNMRIPLNKIYREGISNITIDDIKYGKELGYTIKLLAIAKKIGNKVEARVHPTFIPNKHPLVSVKDSFNAIFVKGDMIGDMMFYGRGAGDLPTGSAIVSDLITACNQYCNFKYREFYNTTTNSDVVFDDNWKTEFFIRLTVKDKSGVLSKIAGVFAKYDVSIASVIQKDKVGDSAPLIFVTHSTGEKSIEKAIVDIKLVDDVVKVENVIRVEN